MNAASVVTPDALDTHAGFAAALLVPDAAIPPGLRCREGACLEDRLAIYRNNVASSLIRALGDTFPCVRGVLGPTRFDALALAFTRHAPPRSPVLAEWGASFPAFVAGLVPCPAWIGDLASLEWLTLRALHAADAPPLPGAALAAALSDPALPALRLALHPSLSPLASPHPLISIWQACQSGWLHADARPVDAHPVAAHPVKLSATCDGAECGLVMRDVQDAVIVTRLPPGGARFIAALSAGLPLGAAAETALRDEAGFDLVAQLTILIRLQAFTAMHFPGAQP